MIATLAPISAILDNPVTDYISQVYNNTEEDRKTNTTVSDDLLDILSKNFGNIFSDETPSEVSGEAPSSMADETPSEVSGEAPSSMADEIGSLFASESPSDDNVPVLQDVGQKLDDYVLNMNSSKITPPSIVDSSKFLASSMAYPDSGYAPYDPLNEDINHYEYVAKEFASSQPDGLSDNPMDPNWGGVMYTQNMIKSGKYVDNNVNKPLLFQPKGIFIDNIPSAYGKPQDMY